jgi:hypothetical protein
MGEVYKHSYDLVVVCTDIVLPKSLSGIKTVWVQEGMVDGYKLSAKIVKTLRLPRYLAMSTALNGSSNLCDIYCAGSEAYRDYFSEKGTDVEKILVTGIPNYDNLQKYLHNDFPLRNYVLVATSDIRETFRPDDRIGFIKQAVEIAAGRQLVFKLHPNEKKERAIAEIRKYAGTDAIIYTDGNTNEMIANCSELITQYSTVVYVGIVLGKKAHSYFDLEDLYRLTPVQNGGRSAEMIADVCGNYIYYVGNSRDFLKDYQPQCLVIR